MHLRPTVTSPTARAPEQGHGRRRHALPEDAIDVVNNPAVVTEVGDQLRSAPRRSANCNYSTTPSL
jgi:hypothetical protein